MKSPRIGLAAVIAGAALCAALAALEEAPAQRTAPAVTGEEIPAPSDSEPLAPGEHFRFVGTASCTAANCHGGDGSRPVRPGGDPYSPQAYSLWIERDPHAGAYEVLFNDVSKQMADRLDLGNAHTAPTCLACHAIDAKESELADAARHTLHDGVGCEACHGAAEAWLDPHKWDAWSSLSAAQKSALGYRDVTGVVERARLCTECHIGSEGRDVNHDLIAAGHPRMAFELSAYHANLPKHWKNESTPAEELDARLWLTGQAISAEASLALLAQRAADADAPWPELSEYDCFACHHDLADPSWRQQEFASATDAKPGSARWGSWPFALFLSAGDPATGDLAIAALRTEMQRALPRREQVAALADDARQQIAAGLDQLASVPLGPDARIAWLSRLTDPQLFAQPLTWDMAAQRFLGCGAFVYSSRLAANQDATAQAFRWERIEAALERIRESLQFGPGAQSPEYDAGDASQPDRRAALRAAFEEIHGALPDAPAQ